MVGDEMPCFDVNISVLGCAIKDCHVTKKKTYQP
jgi:hypothetical protein